MITTTASSGKKSTCTVTVKIKANKIKLNLSSKKLYVGKKTTLKATLTPSGASGKVSWSSSDSSVAAVNKNGKVTAKKTGTAVITAELSNGKKATCKIKVYKKPTKIKLSKKTLKLECSKSATLTYKLSPSPTYGTVTWSSSNPSAVSVTKKGKVTALKQSSSAVITASLSNGVKATCTVTVPTTKADSISIKYKGLYEVETEYYYPGETAQYAVERTPADAPGTVKWTSSNPSVAKISTTGELTCISTGSTTITAVLGDCKATVAITVMGTQEYDVSRGDIRVDVDKGTISQPNGVTGVQTLDLGSPITLFGAKDGKGGASSTGVDVDNDNISSAYLKIVLNGIEFGKDSVGGCSLNFEGVQKGTVEISLAAGTSNYLHGDHAAIQLPSPYSNGPNIKITGSGYLYASCRKGVAIGNTGDWIGHLTIESGTIEMKGLSSMSIAIGGLGCEDVSIGANATLIVWDAEKVVGASKGSDYEKDISILGTVIRKSS
ncbi:MAG: Ig-like domain-containing protein [Lachnospiraceae bacterium]|nr:Ig-like domain-containing protein [Lachnospiraceae bacterium]